MKLEKIKLVNVVDEKMTKDALKLIRGGSGGDGCGSDVCGGSGKIAEWAEYCENAICTVKLMG